VEAHLWRQQFDAARNPLKKFLYWKEWRGLREAELRYARKADHVVTVLSRTALSSRTLSIRTAFQRLPPAWISISSSPGTIAPESGRLYRPFALRQRDAHQDF
jgi:hypothetical protein